jgi:thiamine-monophosphate kinase
MFENTGRTEIASLGEFGLIEHLCKNITLHNSTTIKGVGDDAAIINHAAQQTVLSTDLLLEGVHFDLAYVPLKHLGYKSIMVNLSDIYAMNAKPTQVLVSLGFSSRFSLEAVEELYAGMLLACNKYGVDLVGGDTTSSKSGLVISITAMGYAEESKICTRSGARDSELLVVSGDLGGAYLGLQVLEREKLVFQEAPGSQPSLIGYDYILERQLKPEARHDIKDLLEKLELKPTSMIDISDGLSSEIIHLCKQSGVGCNLYEEKIPVDPQFINVCEEFNIDSTTVAINGGEDYELLFTIKMEDYDKIKANPNFTVIGHMTQESEGIHLITRANTKIPLKARGWDALSE